MVRSWILGLVFVLRTVSFACDRVSVPFNILGLKNSTNGENWMVDISLNASVGEAMYAVKRQLIRSKQLLIPTTVSAFLDEGKNKLTSLENVKKENIFKFYPEYGTLVIKLGNL